MKKTAILLALAAFAASPVSFAQRNDISAPNFSVDFTYANYQVFRGLKESGETMQPCVEAGIGAYGFAGIWANTPFDKDSYYEIDFYAGARGELFDKLHAEAVMTVYYYPDAEGGETGKSYEAGGGLTYDMFGIMVGAKAYYDFRLEAATVEGVISKNIPFKIGSFKFALDADAYVGMRSARNWTPDANVYSPNRPYQQKESYNYYGADMKVSYSFAGNAKLHAGVHYADHDGIYWPDAKVRFTAGLSLAF